MSTCDICDEEVIWVSCAECQETDKIQAYQAGIKAAHKVLRHLMKHKDDKDIINKELKLLMELK